MFACCQRLLLAVTAFCFLSKAIVTIAIAEDEVLFGDCGDGVSWEYVNRTKNLTFHCADCKDGVLAITGFDKETLSLAKSAKHIIIGEGFRTIHRLSFSGFAMLESVEMPSSLEIIGNYAFEFCVSLSTLVLPDSLKTIGDYAFYDCTCLKTVDIPQAVNSIGEGVFMACSNLEFVSINSDITSISDALFEECKSLKSVKLPRKVRTICERAFSGCSALSFIELPPKLDEIGAYAFNRCFNLSSINIPISVTTIEEGAFKSCISLGSVTIPSDVSMIESNSFCGCTNLSTLIISNGVKWIEDNAFSWCSSLTNVTIPSSIQDIELEAFSHCSNLMDFIVDEQNSAFKSIDGVLFDNTVSSLVRCPGGKEGEYSVPNGTKTILAGAFSNCDSITSVTIPSSVSEIEEQAFRGCSHLRNVRISDNCKSIGESAFERCTELTSLTIPSNVKTIANKTFYGCWSLVNITIPANIVSIGDGAFEECRKLRFVNIDSAITTIPSRCFSGCRNLVNITIPDSVEVIGTSAFEKCISLENISIPSSIKTINDTAFLKCHDLRRIEIDPEAINVTIGNKAFSECLRLKSVIIPSNVGSIGTQSFSQCVSLQEVRFESDRTMIMDGAFEGCKNLVSVNLPGNMSRISNGLFNGCMSLKEIGIPDSVRSIGSQAFSHCSNLTNVTIPSNVIMIEDCAYSYCSELRNVGLSNGTEIVGKNVFEGCDNLKNILFPSSVTKIDECALNGMKQLERIDVEETNRQYKSIDGVLYSKNERSDDIVTLVKYPESREGSYDIVEGVRMIGEHAFDGCDGLSNVSIPSSVTSLGSETFSGLKHLKAIFVNPNNSMYQSIGGVLFSSDKTTLLKFPTGRIGSYVIPDATQCIGVGAFSGCEGLAEVIIPKTVNSIGKKAFNGCVSLKKVTIPSNVTTLEESVFEGCNGLESVSIKGNVTEIGNKAFSGCKNLKSFNIPESVKRIGDCSFCDCGLTAITIPRNVSDIGEYPFDGCNSLDRIVVEDGNLDYKSIDGVLFEGDMIIQFPRGWQGAYTMPDYVSLIEVETFINSPFLTSVFISSFLSEIPNGAFYGCKRLTSIDVDICNSFYFSIEGVLFEDDGEITLFEYPEGRIGDYVIPGDVSIIEANAFENCYGLSKITIPSDCLIRGEAFKGCKNLKIVSYEGNGDPAGGDGVFEGCDSLHHICVPQDYYSPFFCDRSNYCQIDLCNERTFTINSCFEETCLDGSLIHEDNEQAKMWENRTNACVNYVCDDDRGLVMESKCVSSVEKRLMCMNDGCLEVTADYLVEVDVSGLFADKFTTHEVAEELSRISGVSVENVGFEFGDGGVVLRVIIVVDDEHTADTLVDAVKNKCKH